MGKVTYLLGAGASRFCLPTVEEIPSRLTEFKEYVEHLFQTIADKDYRVTGSNKIRSSKTIKTTILSELDDLREKVKNHNSIDTYAKKLDVSRIRNGEKYITLKILLSFSFIYEQIRKPVDKRHDAFFASVIKKDYNKLANIRIVSWNYDYQIEKAYSSFSNYQSLLDNQKILSVSPLVSNINSEHVNQFSIFKLNGTTSFEQSDAIQFKTPFDDLYLTMQEVGIQLAEKLIDYYFEVMYNEGSSNRLKPTLSFAWENKDINKKVLANAKRSIADSDALVIIGYSFPFFNREVDKEIFEVLDRKCKIYIEDPNFDDVESNLKSILTKDHGQIRQVKNTTQFFLPPEI